jgi:hypothetical protein
MENLQTTEPLEASTVDAVESRFSSAMDLMSVLSPANPPEPRNARVISGIGLGASRDPQRDRNAARDKSDRREQRRRDRALRRSSLRTAAGFK